MRIFLRLRFNLRVRFFFHLAVRVERRRRRDIFVGQFCFAREKDTTTLFHHHHHFQRERARRRRRRRIGLKNENLATARHPNAPPKRPPKRTRIDFPRIRRFSPRAFRASFLPARGRVVLFLFYFRARAYASFLSPETMPSPLEYVSGRIVDVEKHNLHHQRDASPSVKKSASFSSFSSSSSSKSFRVPLIFPVLSFECLSSSINAVCPQHASPSFGLKPYIYKTLNPNRACGLLKGQTSCVYVIPSSSWKQKKEHEEEEDRDFR